MITLFVGLPDVALVTFIAAGKNHVKHEEGLCVLFGVRHEALERGGSTTGCMQHSKRMVWEHFLTSLMSRV
jgi:hypothetical protein